MMIVGTLILLLLVAHLLAEQPCDIVTWCVEGQKCDGDKCLPCENGTFRPEYTHKEMYCLEWTKKPPGPYWEIKQDGTAESDVVWGCEEGTKQIRSTPVETFCVNDTKTDVVPIATQKPAIVTTSSSTVATPPAVDESSNTTSSSTLDTKWVILIVIMIILFIVGLVVTFLLRKRRNCAKAADVERKAENHINGPGPENSSHSPLPSSTVENSSQAQHVRKLAIYLGNKIEQRQFELLFYGIKSCEEYNPYTRLTFNKDAHRGGGLKPYLETLIQWWEANVEEQNPSILISWITNELESNEINNVIADPEYKQFCYQLCQSDRTLGLSSVENPTIITQNENRGENYQRPEQDLASDKDSHVPQSYIEYPAALDSEDEQDSFSALLLDKTKDRFMISNGGHPQSMSRTNRDDDAIDAPCVDRIKMKHQPNPHLLKMKELCL